MNGVHLASIVSLRFRHLSLLGAISAVNFGDPHLPQAILIVHYRVTAPFLTSTMDFMITLDTTNPKGMVVVNGLIRLTVSAFSTIIVSSSRLGPGLSLRGSVFGLSLEARFCFAWVFVAICHFATQFIFVY